MSGMWVVQPHLFLDSREIFFKPNSFEAIVCGF